MVNELAVQLRKLALNDEIRIDALFLKYNKDRLCFVDIENLKDLCKKLQLPEDEDILNLVGLFRLQWSIGDRSLLSSLHFPSLTSW